MRDPSPNHSVPGEPQGRRVPGVAPDRPQCSRPQGSGRANLTGGDLREVIRLLRERSRGSPNRDLRDVLRGSTRPHRGTWLIWSALAVVVCLAQWADGASWSLIMLLTQAVLTTAVFAVAIVRGQGGTTIIELALIAVAAFAVVLA